MTLGESGRNSHGTKTNDSVLTELLSGSALLRGRAVQFTVSVDYSLHGLDGIVGHTVSPLAPQIFKCESTGVKVKNSVDIWETAMGFVLENLEDIDYSISYDGSNCWISSPG